MTPKEFLELAASASTVLAAISGVGAALFISLQVAHMKRSREVDTFLRILEAGNTESMHRAAQWVKTHVTLGTTYEESGHGECRDNTSRVINHFEVIGILVGKGFISRDLIYDQMGSWIVGSWAILRHLVFAHRVAKHSPDYGENFEILAEEYAPWAKHHPPKLERQRVTPHDLDTFYGGVAEK